VRDSLPKEAEKYMGSLRPTDSVGGADGVLQKLRDGALRCWAISLRKPRAAPPPC
jgi:hypothetical protein